MLITTRTAYLGVAVAVLLWAVEARAQGGPDVLRNQGCLQCHDAGGGKGTAPDLAARLVPEYTVPALAATLWNHTPAMWAKVSATAARQPSPTEAGWEDVFRQLYALQFSDRPAVAARGKNVFESACARCHGADMSNPGPGKPMREWVPMKDPFALIHQMWNHASSMKKAFARDTTRKKLTGLDLLDLTAYLRSSKHLSEREPVALPRPEEGRMLTAKHCGGCHGGSNTFAASLPHNRTLMEMGAAAWNHITRVEALPAVGAQDFRAIMAFVWELQYRGPAGQRARGEQTFANKGCISCHRSPGAQAKAQSPRPGRTFTPLSMVALSWGAGRDMHKVMNEKGVPWPRLSAEDVSNLVAYMNTLGR